MIYVRFRDRTWVSSRHCLGVGEPETRAVRRVEAAEEIRSKRKKKETRESEKF